MHLSSSSIERTITVSFAHRIFFTRSVFSPQNPLLAEIFSANVSRTGHPERSEGSVPSFPREQERTDPSTPLRSAQDDRSRDVKLPHESSPAEEACRESKALVVVDEGVARAFPRLAESITTHFAAESFPAKLVHEPIVVPGGEGVKNNRELVDQLYGEIERHGIDRHSYVLAIGGGALLDAAGFAAATAHRGVRHIRLPTTTLSQADGGVGVKNGINAFGKKNFIGAFAPPFAVINDSDFLAPLPAAEKRAGLIEALKVALIRDAAFFAEIEQSAEALARFDGDALERAVRRCAELHLEHIATSGDPFEFGSARPLDFGHWSAHKLEQTSNFTIPHGTAVAHGVALDVIYSVKSGLLPTGTAERILALVQKLGFALFDPRMMQSGPDGNLLLLDGLEEFREHLGGELTITLLRDIGRGEEVHAVDTALMRESLRELEQRFQP